MTGKLGVRTMARKIRISALGAATGLLVTMGAAAEAGTRLPCGLGMELSTLDPLYQTNNWELATGYDMYDSLVWPLASEGASPWVAESWSVSADGLSGTFVIREGLSFHDGAPLSAEDVVFSMQRMLVLNGPAATAFRGLKAENVAAKEGRSVDFTLEMPNAGFLKAPVAFKIVNKARVPANPAEGPHGAMKEHGAACLRSHDAGSGPFQLRSYSQSELVVLECFADYKLTAWDPLAPEVVEFQIAPEMASIGTKLRAGELDLGDSSLPISVQPDIAKDARFARRQDPTDTAWYIVMKNAAKPLDDVHLRRAIASAHDEGALVRNITGAGGPMGGSVPDAMLPNCADIPGNGFDLDAARGHLGQSKYSAEELKARPPKIAAVAGGERFDNIALLTSSNLKKFGLKDEVQGVRRADIVSAQTKPETALDLVNFYDPVKFNDPMLFMNGYREQGWGDPYPPGGMHCGNREVTALLEKAQTSTDAVVQQEAYCAAADKITEDSPAVFSHSEVRNTIFWPYGTAYPDGGGAMFYDMRFENWRLDTASAELKQNQP